MQLLKTSIQNYLNTYATQDDRVFCRNDECNGLIQFSRNCQACLTCGRNVCPKCQVIDDELHVERTCAQLVEEKKRREFLTQLFEAAKKFVQDDGPTDSQMVPIGQIDENPYLEKQYKSLKRVFAYHGTVSQAMVPICQIGFDPKRRSGQVHGPGEYFGVVAKMSHGYSQRSRKHLQSSQMIIAYIIRGAYLKTVQNFCYVIMNPTDWKYAFNLPVLIVIYGESEYSPTSPFPIPIPNYADDEQSYVAPFR
ncbi:unnamed protein product [Rotaria sp. Silwood2]|nr:unnamed protein product [Rotaria sp. Silwood2]CAF4122640.1 unnamed protein product [Rotaria sp. Silwood2]